MLTLIAGLLLAQTVTGDIRDKNGQRVGTIRANPYGGFDLYDKNSNRLGHGRTSPYNPDVIELFDHKGNRLGTIRQSPGQERRK